MLLDVLGRKASSAFSHTLFPGLSPSPADNITTCLRRGVRRFTLGDRLKCADAVIRRLHLLARAGLKHNVLKILTHL